MDLKSTYNIIATDWYKENHDSEWWRRPTDKLLGFLKKGDKILDVGCGPGLKAEYLSHKGFSVVGIDFSEKMIELAKRHCPAADFFVKDIRQTLDLGIFEAIFAQAILLHIPKKEIAKVLENLWRSLKDKGFFYLAVKEQRPDGIAEKILKENDYGYEYERFFSFFSVPEIEGYLTDLGMNLVHKEIVLRNSTNWIIVIAQK